MTIRYTSAHKKWLRLLLGILLLTVLFTNGCRSEKTGDDKAVIEINGEGILAPAKVSLEQMKGMEAGLVEADFFSLNSYGTREYTAFKGVWLWHLLQETVELKDDATQVTIVAEDGYQVTYTLEEVQRKDYLDEQNSDSTYPMIIAWEQAGQPFDPDQGNPFQLVVGQREPGDVNKPYWVRHIITLEVK